MRLPQPAPHLEAPNRESGFVSSGEPRDPPTRRCRVAHDEQSGNAARLPSAIVRDLGSETRLPIKHVKRFLAVRHDRLDLDDEDDS
jgi:hypothetical protein